MGKGTPRYRAFRLHIIKQTCIEQKGKLIIPAFSVGRTQEIVYMLDQLVKENLLPNVPVYVDLPLAVNATRVFEMHPECFDKDILSYMQHDANPFGYIQRCEISPWLTLHLPENTTAHLRYRLFCVYW